MYMQESNANEDGTNVVVGQNQSQSSSSSSSGNEATILDSSSIQLQSASHGEIVSDQTSGDRINNNNSNNCAPISAAISAQTNIVSGGVSGEVPADGIQLLQPLTDFVDLVPMEEIAISDDILVHTNHGSGHAFQTSHQQQQQQQQQNLSFSTNPVTATSSTTTTATTTTNSDNSTSIFRQGHGSTSIEIAPHQADISLVAPGDILTETIPSLNSDLLQHHHHQPQQQQQPQHQSQTDQSLNNISLSSDILMIDNPLSSTTTTSTSIFAPQSTQQAKPSIAGGASQMEIQLPTIVTPNIRESSSQSFQSSTQSGSSQLNQQQQQQQPQQPQQITPFVAKLNFAPTGVSQPSSSIKISSQPPQQQQQQQPILVTNQGAFLGATTNIPHTSAISGNISYILPANANIGGGKQMLALKTVTSSAASISSSSSSSSSTSSITPTFVINQLSGIAGGKSIPTIVSSSSSLSGQQAQQTQQQPQQPQQLKLLQTSQGQQLFFAATPSSSFKPNNQSLPAIGGNLAGKIQQVQLPPIKANQLSQIVGNNQASSSVAAQQLQQPQQQQQQQQQPPHAQQFSLLISSSAIKSGVAAGTGIATKSQTTTGFTLPSGMKLLPQVSSSGSSTTAAAAAAAVTIGHVPGSSGTIVSNSKLQQIAPAPTSTSTSVSTSSSMIKIAANQRILAPAPMVSLSGTSATTMTIGGKQQSHQQQIVGQQKPIQTIVHSKNVQYLFMPVSSAQANTGTNIIFSSASSGSSSSSSSSSTTATVSGLSAALTNQHHHPILHIAAGNHQLASTASAKQFFATTTATSGSGGGGAIVSSNKFLPLRAFTTTASSSSSAATTGGSAGKSFIAMNQTSNNIITTSATATTAITATPTNSSSTTTAAMNQTVKPNMVHLTTAAAAAAGFGFSASGLTGNVVGQKVLINSNTIKIASAGGAASGTGISASAGNSIGTVGTKFATMSAPIAGTIAGKPTSIWMLPKQHVIKMESGSGGGPIGIGSFLSSSSASGASSSSSGATFAIAGVKTLATGGATIASIPGSKFIPIAPHPTQQHLHHHAHHQAHHQAHHHHQTISIGQAGTISTAASNPQSSSSSSSSAIITADHKLTATNTLQKINPVQSIDSSHEESRRKPCNCTRSQCLKLYCDCFANGEFCHNCNCISCCNNLSNEVIRQKAIRLCLERNPNAFHPKIGQHSQHGDVERKHTKGCCCKRSGCLKNYCECYEAKILCSDKCKCVGCKNFEESTERKTLMHLADAAEFRSVQQAYTSKVQIWGPDLKLKLPVKIKSDSHPFNIFTMDILETTASCLLAQAEEGEFENYSEDNVESLILEQFGECLSQILNMSQNGVGEEFTGSDDDDEDDVQSQQDDQNHYHHQQQQHQHQQQQPQQHHYLSVPME